MSYPKSDRTGGSGGKKYTPRGGGRSFGGRDSGKPSIMHHAICTACDKECEVPFKPFAGKPVYCRDCFNKDEDSDSREFGESSPRNGGGSHRFSGGRGNDDFDDRKMHKATCATCGNECEVPFKPSGEKPIYCKKCFGTSMGKQSGGAKSGGGTAMTSEQFEILNSKLDIIIEALEQ